MVSDRASLHQRTIRSTPSSHRINGRVLRVPGGPAGRSMRPPSPPLVFPAARANLTRMSAPEPVVVTISHRLGRDEAKRRLDDGLSQVLRQLAPFVGAIEQRWDGYRLDFGLKALRQTINGRIDVEDRLLRIELALPLVLQLLSGTIASRLRGAGTRLLEKPDDTRR